MYRLMQSSQTTIPNVATFTHLFSHSRTHNRVEFLTDFPVGDDAEIISSLQVHPQGWCALSRNVSNGEKSEVGINNIYTIHFDYSRSCCFSMAVCFSGLVFTIYKNATCPVRQIKRKKERKRRRSSTKFLWKSWKIFNNLSPPVRV